MRRIAALADGAAACVGVDRFAASLFQRLNLQIGVLLVGGGAGVAYIFAHVAGARLPRVPSSVSV